MSSIVVAMLLVLGLGAEAPGRQEWTLRVDGAERTALVYSGGAATPSPVVFVFHGLGGTSAAAAAMTKMHEAWPEATVVYPQALPVPGLGAGRVIVGWQAVPGHLGDRDLRFVDALLVRLRETVKVDPRRVFATGFSNGAYFTYLLMAARPRPFAAFAPVSGGLGQAKRYLEGAALVRPVLVVHGKEDLVVPLSHMTDALAVLRTTHRCTTATRRWAPGFFTYVPKSSGQPVTFHIHDGGHDWPPALSADIARFFREQSLPAPPKEPGSSPAPAAREAAR